MVFPVSSSAPENDFSGSSTFFFISGDVSSIISIVFPTGFSTSIITGFFSKPISISGTISRAASLF